MNNSEDNDLETRIDIDILLLLLLPFLSVFSSFDSNLQLFSAR